MRATWGMEGGHFHLWTSLVLGAIWVLIGLGGVIGIGWWGWAWLLGTAIGMAILIPVSLRDDAADARKRSGL